MLKRATEYCFDEDLADSTCGSNPFDECGKALHERRYDRTFVRVAALSVGVETLACASDQVKADKAFMLTMVQVGRAGHGWALEYAS